MPFFTHHHRIGLCIGAAIALLLAALILPVAGAQPAQAADTSTLIRPAIVGESFTGDLADIRKRASCERS